MAEAGSSFSKIVVRNLCKNYDTRPVLRRLNCDFVSGQISAVLGENGAGKSTFLSILSTVSSPTSGDITYDGSPHQRARLLFRHRIGLLGHQLMLYNDLSVIENLKFFGRLYDLSDLSEQAEHWLSAVELWRARDIPVSQLSRGMAQRVSLARLLMMDPSLIILDEPTTGLDLRSIEIYRKQILAAKERGKTIVLATHDFPSLPGLADRLVVFNKGRVSVRDDISLMDCAQLQALYESAIGVNSHEQVADD